MGEVLRYDVVELRKPQRHPNGWLRCDAYLTRPGVFEYLEADGKIRRELRLPDDVFHADSLATLQMVPITMRHPRDEQGRKILLDATNTQRFAVGHLGEQVDRDDARVRGSMLVTDANAVAAVESAAARQVSCGYRCDATEAPGVTKGIAGIPDGLAYDAIQKNIRYNHVAIEPIGRAGPDIGIRLDAGDAIAVVPDQSQQHKEPIMAKIRIDGVDYEASEQLAQAITVSNEKHAKDIEAARAETKQRTDAADASAKDIEAKAKEIETLKARADAADESLKKAKAEFEAATKPERVQQAVKARVALERDAAKVLGADAKFDGMDDLAIKRAVVVKACPEAAEKMKGASEVYVHARYDGVMEKAAEIAERTADADEAARAIGQRTDSTNELAKARSEHAQKVGESWKQK